MNLVFETALGSYRVQRLPLRKNQPLQAWDAADELLLNTLAQDHSNSLQQLADNIATDNDSTTGNSDDNRHDSFSSGLLIVNDQFGALAAALHQYNPECWSDSSISHAATEFNFRENFDTPRETSKTYTSGSDSVAAIEVNGAKEQLAIPDALSFRPISSVSGLAGHYAVVLIKIPKTLALLEQQLMMLSAHVDSNTLIIAAGMTRHIHNSTIGLFEKNIGVTRTSRATKKARLIFSESSAAAWVESSAAAFAGEPGAEFNLLESRYFCEPLHSELISYANGFSRERLDIGARAMLEALEKNTLPTARHVADLGCGNGVLGLYAIQQIAARRLQKADQSPAAQPLEALSISFIDESYMAIAAAKKNFQRIHAVLENSSEDSPVENSELSIKAFFVAQDGVAEKKNKRYDWIICNPPFHIGTTTDTSVAKRMVQQSYQSLQRNGQLWVVANRHLNYAEFIQSLFKNHKVILNNSKFVVISAIKK